MCRELNKMQKSNELVDDILRSIDMPSLYKNVTDIASVVPGYNKGEDTWKINEEWY